MMNVTLNKEIHLSLNVCTPVVFFSENVRGNLSLAWFKLFSLYKQNNPCRAVKLSCYFEGSDRCRNSLK